MSDTSLRWELVLAVDGPPQWRLTSPPPLLTPEDQAAALADIATHLGIAPREDGFWVSIPNAPPNTPPGDQEIWHRPLDGALTQLRPTEGWSDLPTTLGLIPLAPASPPPPPAPPIAGARRRRATTQLPSDATPPRAAVPPSLWLRPATLLTAVSEGRSLPTPTLSWRGHAWVRVGYPTQKQEPAGPWAGSISFSATALEQHPVGRAWLQHWLLPASGAEPLGDDGDRTSLMRRGAVLARTALRATRPLGPSVWADVVVPPPLARWIQFRGLQICGRTSAARPLRRQFQQYSPGTQLRLIATAVLSGPAKNIYHFDGAIARDLLEPEHRALLDWLLATLPQWARTDRVMMKPGTAIAEHFSRIARGDPVWATNIDDAWLRLLAAVMDAPAYGRTARAHPHPAVADPEEAPAAVGLSHAQMVQCERVLQQWQGTRGGEIPRAAVASHPVWQRYLAARRQYQTDCCHLERFTAHVEAASALRDSGLGPGDWLAHAPVAPLWLQGYRTTVLGGPMAPHHRDGRPSALLPTAWGAQTYHSPPCDPTALQHALDNPALSPADVSAWLHHWLRLRPQGEGSEMSQLLWSLACVAFRMGVLDDPDLVAELSAVPPAVYEASPAPRLARRGHVLTPDFAAARDTLDLGVACLARASAWDALTRRFASVRHEEPEAPWTLEVGQRLLLACAGNADQWRAQQAALAPWLRAMGRQWSDDWSWARRRAIAAAQHGMRLGIGHEDDAARRLWTPWMLLPDRDLRLQIVSHLAAGAAAVSPDAPAEPSSARSPRRGR